MSANEGKAARSGVRFGTEEQMVDEFVEVLSRKRSDFGRVEVTREWDHKAGFVDVLARDRDHSLIAFEAKLCDWKRAFMQAYRSTAYADRTYVLLPDAAAERALANRADFEDRGIGLCRFDGDRVEVLVEAAEQEPLVAWVRKRAHDHFDELRHESGERAAAGRRRRMQTALA